MCSHRGHGKLDVIGIGDVSCAWRGRERVCAYVSRVCLHVLPRAHRRQKHCDLSGYSGELTEKTHCSVMALCQSWPGCKLGVIGVGSTFACCHCLAILPTILDNFSEPDGQRCWSRAKSSGQAPQHMSAASEAPCEGFLLILGQRSACISALIDSGTSRGQARC